MEWHHTVNPDHRGTALCLEMAFRNDRVPSAYLFVGPAGVGKTALAKQFAQLLNCDDHSLCHHCENCRLFERDSHPDFHLIEPNGQNIRIAQIQTLITQLNLKPTYARHRVVLVKEAQKMNQESANAFLKIL